MLPYCANDRIFSSRIVVWPQAVKLNVPGPAEQRGCSAGQGHDPCECQPKDGVFLPKAKVGHRLTDHNVALDGQNHQRPESDLS